MPSPRLPTCLAIALAGALAESASASPYGQPPHHAGVELSVEPGGSIGECAVVTPSDQPDQDSLACDILRQRGKASLGRDRAARIRTVTYWLGDSADSRILIQPDDPRVTIAPRAGSAWLMASDYPDELLHGASAATTVYFTVSANGRPVSCRGDRTSGNPALEGWACHIVESRRLFPLGQTPEGRPATYQSSVRLFWTAKAIRACDQQDECWKLKEWAPPADLGKSQ